jgi:hypothetical protein
LSSGVASIEATLPSREGQPYRLVGSPGLRINLLAATFPRLIAPVARTPDGPYRALAVRRRLSSPITVAGQRGNLTRLPVLRSALLTPRVRQRQGRVLTGRVLTGLGNGTYIVPTWRRTSLIPLRAAGMSENARGARPLVRQQPSRCIPTAWTRRDLPSSMRSAIRSTRGSTRSATSATQSAKVATGMMRDPRSSGSVGVRHPAHAGLARRGGGIAARAAEVPGRAIRGPGVLQAAA